MDCQRATLPACGEINFQTPAMTLPIIKRAPLKQLTVLDLADEKASFCSRILNDLGADIVKIEKPGGDRCRTYGPFLHDGSNTQDSLSFSYNNSGKKSITLDLERAEGKKLFCRLLEMADIVVESFSPTYRKKHGLHFNLAKNVNPKLIWVSVTGFGRNGPRSDYSACDLAASAYGGMMYVNGNPSGVPLKPYGDQSYYLSSLYAAIGVLLSLRKRDISGQGEYLDVSLQEAAVSCLDHVMIRYFYQQIIAKRQGKIYWNKAFCILSCLDGSILLTPFQQWDVLIEWLNSEGMAEDLKDEKYHSENCRIHQAEHIITVLEKWTKTHTVMELFEKSQQLRFPWAPVWSIKEVLKNPQLENRKFFVKVPDGQSGKIISWPRSPIRFDDAISPESMHVPLPGEDNAQVYLSKLKIAAKEYQKLCSLNVI